jgi:hypothetical protein
MSLRQVRAPAGAPPAAKSRFQHVLALGAASRTEAFSAPDSTTDAPTVAELTMLGDELMAEYREIDVLRKEQALLEKQVDELVAEKKERLQNSRRLLGIGCYASEVVPVNQMKYLDLLSNLRRATQERKALEKGNAELRAQLDRLTSPETPIADLPR